MGAAKQVVRDDGGSHFRGTSRVDNEIRRFRRVFGAGKVRGAANLDPTGRRLIFNGRLAVTRRHREEVRSCLLADDDAPAEFPPGRFALDPKPVGKSRPTSADRRRPRNPPERRLLQVLGPLAQRYREG